MPSPTSPSLEENTAARIAVQEQRFDDALRLLDQRLTRDPDNVEALCLGALAHWRAHRDFAIAQAHLDRALALRPKDASVLTLCAEFALHLGEIDTVYALADQAIAIDGTKASALVVLARADAGRVSDGVLRKMMRLSENANTKRSTLRSLHNAIGKVFDARGDYDAAFHYFARSHEASAGHYDPTVQENRLAQTRRFFTRDFFDERPSFGIRNMGRIFMLGMPRSGSTLIEQMLVAHPNIVSCGESDALSQINHALSRKLSPQGRHSGHFAHLQAISGPRSRRAAQSYLAITAQQSDIDSNGSTIYRRLDKKLSNFLHAGLIRLMFPDAVLLHTHRHPLDVCLSCYTQGFDGHYYANNLETLGHFYLIYRSYLQFWAELFPDGALHISYEAYVGSHEKQARELLGRLGIEWHDACASPHLAKRFVATASAAQVKAPVHGAAVHRWENYKKHLLPLIRTLGGLEKIEEMHAQFG